MTYNSLNYGVQLSAVDELQFSTGGIITFISDIGDSCGKTRMCGCTVVRTTVTSIAVYVSGSVGGIAAVAVT